MSAYIARERRGGRLRVLAPSAVERDEAAKVGLVEARVERQRAGRRGEAVGACRCGEI